MNPDNQITLAISEQYGAAFKMLEDIVIRCDDNVWNDPTRETVISQVVYHTLYNVDQYLSKDESERNSFKGKYGADFPSFHQPDKLFTKDQLKTYLKEIRSKADNLFNNLTITTLNNPPVFVSHGSSFLSSLLYDLRHIMLHIGALHVRVNSEGKMPLRWVSKTPEDEGAEESDLALFYLQNGDLLEAENLYVKLTTNSEIPTHYYNLACCYSLQNKLDQSIESLKECLKLDNTDRFKNLAKEDPDFTNLRKAPEFDMLIK